MRRRAAYTWAIALIALCAGTAGADWLVMNDGSRLETRGAWKVKGPMVVFTLPNGTLSSLRADEIDLDASAVATVEAEEAAEAALQPAPAPPSAARTPIAVLTTADIGEARSVAPAEPESADADGEATDPSPVAGLQAEPIDVEVASWRDVDSIAVQGVEIRGLLRNSGDTLARELVLLVSLYDDKGELVASAEAFLDKYMLQPSATTNFRVLFPEVATYFGDPGFQVRGRGPLYGKITGISNPREAAEDDGDS